MTDELETPLPERAEALRLAAYAQHGLLGTDGELIDSLIEDIIFDAVLTAECFKTADRKTTAITRTVLTRKVVPNMPGPGDYQDTDDPEAAELAWSQVNTQVYRMCDMNKGGRVQERLNGEHALVLCRTKATSEKGVEGVYVTKNWACLQADFVNPDAGKVDRAIKQMADNAEMGAERLPEHGKKFRREFNAATKNALTAGSAKITRMIESGDTPDDDDTDAEADASGEDV